MKIPLLSAVLALAAVASPPAAAALTDGVRQQPAPMLKSPSAPRGEFYVVVPAYDEIGDYSRAFYGTLQPSNGEISPIHYGNVFTNGDDYYVQGGAVRRGILYIPEFFYDADGMVTGSHTVRWKRFDLRRGCEMEPLVFGSDQNALNMFFYSMTYVEELDKFYGLALDLQTGSGNMLVEVDCSAETWSPAFIGNISGRLGGFFNNIVYNPEDSKLYSLKDNGTLYEIDPERCNAYEVMQYDDINEFFAFNEPFTGVAICYSPYDHAFLYVYRDYDAMTFRLISIDARTFEAMELSELYPRSYVSTIYCADAYAPDSNPDRVSGLEVEFSGTSLEGTFSCTLPLTDFCGETRYDRQLSLHASVDGVELPVLSGMPGATVSAPLQLSQGNHELVVYAADGSKEGAKSRIGFYTGQDIPLPPSDLRLKGGVLSWEAPAASGVNGGDIDASKLVYNVYVNGALFNASPITTTSVPFSFTEKIQYRSEVTVIAIADGTASAPAAPLTRVLGRGDDLPAAYTPTESEADLFDTVNVNADKYAFTYTTDGTEKGFKVFTNDYTVAPDDWLFLPPVYIDSPDELYDLSFIYRNATGNTMHIDNLDVCIGSDPLPEAMTAEIYSHEARNTTEETRIDTRFSVPHAGTWFIGFHSRPGDNNRYRGVWLRDFSISAGKSSVKAPADPADVTVAGAPLGAKEVTVAATLPTKAIDGSELQAETEVALTLSLGDDSVAKKGRPGEKVTMSLPVDESGIYFVTLTPSAGQLEGIGRIHRVFAGIDTPLPPANVKGTVSADNLSVTLTWDAVPSTGVNGGYVDTSKVSYDIYTQSSTGASLVANAGNALTYTYSLPAGTVPTNINVGPVAVNESGTSTGGIFFSDLLGEPYNVPMKEEFGSTKFDCMRWTFNETAPYENVRWEHCTTTNGLGIGDPTFGIVGGLLAVPTAPGSVEGELMVPKACTLHATSPMVKIRYWNYPGVAAMQLWGRSASDQQPSFIAEITPTGESRAWEEWCAPLPEEFCGQGWVQINLRISIPAGGFMLIDSYAITQDVDYDFGIGSLTVPYSVILGDHARCDVTVVNAGDEPTGGNLKIELLSDGKSVDSEEITIGRLASGDTYEHSASFAITEAYWDSSRMEIRATACSNDDTNPSNNEAVAEFILFDNAIPTVHDLRAERSGAAVNLTWSAPEGKTRAPESFENVTPLLTTDRIGVWQNIDLDGKAPFKIDGLSWPGDNLPCAWQAFNAEAMGTASDPRLSPHTGRQMLIARSCEFNENEKPYQSSDWLISPEVKGGTEVNFWMNCISAQYKETIELWYSSTGTRLDKENAVYDSEGHMTGCGDFRKICNFTKSGDETWELCKATLPADARYFAFVYASFGNFMAMIDDVIYTPAADLPVAIDSYDVVFIPEGGEASTVASGVETAGFTLKESSPKAGNYHVAVNVEDNGNLFSGALSNPAPVGVNGVESVDGGTAVFIGGGKGCVLIGGASGMSYSIADTTGRIIAAGTVTSDRMTTRLPAGIYIVTTGGSRAKIRVR